LWLEARPAQMRLLPAVGCVHVAGEEEVQSCPAAAEMANRIRPVLIDKLQFGLNADAAHSLAEELRHAQFAAGRARNIHHLCERVANPVRIDELGGLGELGM